MSQKSEKNMAETNPEHSFIVLANRLPVDRCEDTWQAAPGGLVSALAPMVRAERGAWLGWTGGFDETIPPFEFDQMSLVPVPLTEAEHRTYYEGFSNGVLWPLYHDLIVTPQYHRTWWRASEAINSRFAQAAVRSAAFGATIWVHDYHLQLVPHMIRLLRPDVRIGFFNHIPFPPPSSCSGSCPGAEKSSKVCSEPTSSASSATRTRRTSGRRCVNLPSMPMPRLP